MTEKNFELKKFIALQSCPIFATEMAVSYINSCQQSAINLVIVLAFCLLGFFLFVFFLIKGWYLVKLQSDLIKI